MFESSVRRFCPPEVTLLLAATTGDFAQAKNAMTQIQTNTTRYKHSSSHHKLDHDMNKNTNTNNDTGSKINMSNEYDTIATIANTTDARGQTALHLAAVHGHAHITSLLLQASLSTTTTADPGSPGTRASRSTSSLVECVTPGDRLTPLRLAAERGHLETVRVLLDYGASVSARDRIDQATPLHAAAEAGHAEVVVELIRHGADVEARAVSGQTPLRWALSLGQVETTAVLLQLGADPDAPDRLGASCLHGVAALQDHHSQQQQAEQLLDDDFFQPPVVCSAYCSSGVAVTAAVAHDELHVDHLGEVQSFCSSCGGDDGSMSPHDSVSSFCSASSSEMFSDESEPEAISMAASEYTGLGCDNARSSLCPTVVVTAAVSPSPCSCPSSPSGRAKPATFCLRGDGGALRRRSTPRDLAELLLSYGARADFVKRSPRATAPGSSSSSDHYSNNSVPNMNGNMPPGINAAHSSIHVSPGQQHPSAVCTIRCRTGGCSEDSIHIKNRVVGETPLHVAARESSVRVVETLLRAGSDPNAKTTAEEGGLSPLHCAAAPGGGEEHRSTVVRLLLSAGADADAVAADGVTTPLRRACENGAVGCVEELLRWNSANSTSQFLVSPPSVLPPACSTASRVVGSDVSAAGLAAEAAAVAAGYGGAGGFSRCGSTDAVHPMLRACGRGSAPGGRRRFCVPAASPASSLIGDARAGATAAAASSSGVVLASSTAAQTHSCYESVSFLADSSCAGAVPSAVGWGRTTSDSSSGSSGCSSSRATNHSPLTDQPLLSAPTSAIAAATFSTASRTTTSVLSNHAFRRLVSNLEQFVGVRVPAAARDPADLEKIRILLRNAPAERAWQRRGWLVMLYRWYVSRTSTSCCFRSSAGGVDINRTRRFLLPTAPASDSRTKVQVERMCKHPRQDDAQQQSQFQASSSADARASWFNGNGCCSSVPPWSRCVRGASITPPQLMPSTASTTRRKWLMPQVFLRSPPKHQLSSENPGEIPLVPALQSQSRTKQRERTLPINSGILRNGSSKPRECPARCRCCSTSSTTAMPSKKQRGTATPPATQGPATSSAFGVGSGVLTQTNKNVDNHNNQKDAVVGGIVPLVHLAPLIGSLFEIQGDQSILRQVVQWL